MHRMQDDSYSPRRHKHTIKIQSVSDKNISIFAFYEQRLPTTQTVKLEKLHNSNNICHAALYGRAKFSSARQLCKARAYTSYVFHLFFFLLRIRILTSIDVYARALHCKSRVYDEQFALAKQQHYYVAQSDTTPSQELLILINRQCKIYHLLGLICET